MSKYNKKDNSGGLKNKYYPSESERLLGTSSLESDREKSLIKIASEETINLQDTWSKEVISVDLDAIKDNRLLSWLPTEPEQT